MVEPHSSNFRVITTKYLGVQIFRKLMVILLPFMKYISDETKSLQKINRYVHYSKVSNTNNFDIFYFFVYENLSG